MTVRSSRAASGTSSAATSRCANRATSSGRARARRQPRASPRSRGVAQLPRRRRRAASADHVGRVAGSTRRKRSGVRVLRVWHGNHTCCTDKDAALYYGCCTDAPPRQRCSTASHALSPQLTTCRSRLCCSTGAYRALRRFREDMTSSRIGILWTRYTLRRLSWLGRDHVHYRVPHASLRRHAARRFSTAPTPTTLSSASAARMTYARTISSMADA